MDGRVSEWVNIWIPGWYTNGYMMDKWLAFPIFLLQSNCFGFLESRSKRETVKFIYRHIPKVSKAEEPY